MYMSHFQPMFRLRWPSAVDIVNSSPYNAVYCSAVDVLHANSLKLEWIENEWVVHTANTRLEQLFQLLQLCFGGRQSCKPTGASVAAAKLLLEHQKVAQGMDWLYRTPLSLPCLLFFILSHAHAVALIHFDLSLHPSFSHLSHLFSFLIHLSLLSQTHTIFSLLTLFLVHSLYKRMFYSFSLHGFSLISSVN